MGRCPKLDLRGQVAEVVLILARSIWVTQRSWLTDNQRVSVGTGRLIYDGDSNILYVPPSFDIII